MLPNEDRPQPSAVAAQVDDLVLRACAAVRERGRKESKGTAFRISPEYVVTASHVVGGRRDSQWDLRFSGGDVVPAQVVLATPAPDVDGSTFPPPDVAVLRIDPAAAPDAPAVLLGEPEPEVGASLRVCGLNLANGDPSFERLSYTLADRMAELRLDKNVLRQGKSGGPVYSVQDGMVCAFVKATMHANVPLGGFCVPVLQALRDARDDDLYLDIVHSHDAYHRGRPEWPSLAIGDTAARERFARVVGLLPELAEPVSRLEVNDHYRQLCPAMATPLGERRLVAARDLAEFIRVRTGTSMGEVPRLTRLCLALAERPGTPEAVRAELVEHARTIATRWGVGPSVFEGLAVSARVAGVDIIIGVVQPAMTAVQNGEPHEWELFRYQQGEVISQTGARLAGSYDDAVGALRWAIHEYLDSTAQNVEIQVALPDDRLSEERLPAWRRAAGDGRDLGRFSDDGYRVVPRRSKTFVRSVGARGLMTRHLSALKNAGASGLAWLDCWEGRDDEQLGNLFATHHGAGSNEPPSELVFDKADQRSYPLMVWRASPCEDHATAGETCAGKRFRYDLVTALASDTPDQWGRGILEVHTDLVRGTLDKRDPRRAWHDVVYVLDRPELTRRAAPLGAG